MIVQDVITHLEALAPLAYAEEFDNVGLLVGDKTTKVTLYSPLNNSLIPSKIIPSKQTLVIIRRLMN